MKNFVPTTPRYRASTTMNENWGLTLYVGPSELPPRLKSAVEELLGRPIDAVEEISIVAVPPQRIPPSDENRSAAG